jgi:tRNA(Ile)-lysidine synthase
MVTPLHEQVRRTIRRHQLLPSGALVVAGVSGGSDSVALIHLLLDLGEHGSFRMAGMAHMNHRLRASSDRDEQFCRALAEGLRLPILVETADVRGYAAAQRLSLEDAARRLRYDFLSRAAAALDASRIAVGHTRDDQAETFLLKLLRGAGLGGLAAVYPRRGAVVRPLLDVTRGQLREYLSSRGIGWLEDETNEDLTNPRNRVRHVLLPHLERLYGGGVGGALARAAELARLDTSWLDEEAARRFERLATRTDDALAFDVMSLAAEPPPIMMRILRLALRTLGGGEIGFQHVQAVADVLAGACRGTEVPGARVELRRGQLVLLKQGLSRSDTLT